MGFPEEEAAVEVPAGVVQAPEVVVRPAWALRHEIPLQEVILLVVVRRAWALRHEIPLQEAALLVDRSDISEEVVRAASHLAQFRDYLADDAPAGRNLNFLLQELVREFNTMGAKVGSADAAHAIVAVKTELEKLKEQVQNVE